MTYYAHTRGEDKAAWQTVLEHLKNTSDLARLLGQDTGLADFAAAAAMFHDIGKYSLGFQQRLEGGPVVDHVTAGAKVAKELFAARGQDIFGRMLAYCIIGHHGGLPDAGTPADTEVESTLYGRFKRKLCDFSAYEQEIDTSQLSIPRRFPTGFRPIPDAPGFSLSFATRMIYSILVDADFLDTETFCSDGEKPRGGYGDISKLAHRFELFLSRFNNPQRPIDIRRTETLNACIAQANESHGFFTLTLPTGAGKTFSSMAFALQHAKVNGMKRIIYVIPYTSIIEQNAAEFKKSLGQESILEHHSNFDWHPNDKKNVDDFQSTSSLLYKLKLAAENWDVPIIVTTNVQFFESLFSNRSSKSRKVHNLAKSVLIFDEAQMLPRDYLKPCMYAVAELVNNYGASAVFCTATQPIVDKFLPPGTTINELIPNPQSEFDFYRRVQVVNIGKLSDEELVEQIDQYNQALCIVNTRKHAKGLYQNLQEEGRYHLSTLMCAAHRSQVISEIRKRLADNLPCRVISTQLLEAGVDLDFPVGYRSLAGLESIIQAAGRVNREGKQALGHLFVFEPVSDFVGRTPAYIQQTAEVARMVLKDYADPICMEAVQAYFKELYYLQGRDAYDRKGILGCFENGLNPPLFDFKTASERFKLIENDTVSVIVRFDETAEELLYKLQSTEFPFSVTRSLQQYVVNIYEREYQSLLNAGVIDIYCERFAVLRNPEFYNDDTGLIIPEFQGGQAVFFDG